METKQFDIQGMHCASCAANVEKHASALPGVKEASVNLATEKLQVRYDPEEFALDKLKTEIDGLGYVFVAPALEASTTIPIEGMTCASCAQAVEKELVRLPGVTFASVNLATEKASVRYRPDETGQRKIREAIQRAGYKPLQSTKPSQAEEDRARREEGIRKMWRRVIIAAVFCLPLLYLAMAPMISASLPIPAFLDMHTRPLNFALAQLLLLLPILWAGHHFYISGTKAALRRAPNMDTLVAMGTSAAIIYSLWETILIAQGSHEAVHGLYYESAGVIITLILLGKTLEAVSKGRTGEAVKALLALTPKTAILLSGEEEREIPVEEVEAGDILLLRPGARVPVDGVIISGASGLDESAMTGESMPVMKEAGDQVFAATLNTTGSLRFRAEKVGDDTALAQIIRLVEEAQGSKAPIARLADKVSGIFVPVVFAIALIAGIAWLIATGDINFALRVFIPVLVIACPCALGLATPTAIMVGTGKGAEHGILIKSGQALETAQAVDTVVLDKTGTLTQGEPQVRDILPQGNLDENQLLSLAASLESGSEHPLGQAILLEARARGLALSEASGFEALAGFGVKGQVAGQEVLIGNQALLENAGVPVEALVSKAQALAEGGKTPMYVALSGKPAGLIAVADKLKDTSREAVSKMKALGLEVMMLTGDNARTAQAIASEAGITRVLADVKPGEKADAVKALQAEGRKVAMVGDGINDAPALAQADIGIAIGSGTDVAIESADIVLMRSNLQDVATAIKLSRQTLRTIKQNLFWAFGYNMLGIPVAAGVLHLFGGPLLNPMIAAAAMSFSSVSVLLNALRLKRFRP